MVARKDLMAIVAGAVGLSVVAGVKVTQWERASPGKDTAADTAPASPPPQRTDNFAVCVNPEHGEVQKSFYTETLQQDMLGPNANPKSLETAQRRDEISIEVLQKDIAKGAVPTNKNGWACR